jgi:DNA-binding transcriptional regulator YiaG
MANIASLLKAEITRLSRREIRKELAILKKASVTARHHIAALRRQIAQLESKAGQLAKRAQIASSSEITTLPNRPVRFVPKGLKSLRKRLGLSAAQLAKLLGVSEQSIYNWETRKATPRKEQFAALIGLREIGKREAHARLAEKAPEQQAKKATKRAKRK